MACVADLPLVVKVQKARLGVHIMCKQVELECMRARSAIHGARAGEHIGGGHEQASVVWPVVLIRMRDKSAQSRSPRRGRIVFATLELGELQTSSISSVRCPKSSFRFGGRLNVSLEAGSSYRSELEVEVRSRGEDGGLAVVSDFVALHDVTREEGTIGCHVLSRATHPS